MTFPPSSTHRSASTRRSRTGSTRSCGRHPIRRMARRSSASPATVSSTCMYRSARQTRSTTVSTFRPACAAPGGRCAMSGRERLTNRRASETFAFDCGPHRYVATVSFFPSTDRLAEVFLGNGRSGSDIDAAAKDSAVVASHRPAIRRVRRRYPQGVAARQPRQGKLTARLRARRHRRMGAAMSDAPAEKRPAPREGDSTRTAGVARAAVRILR